MNIYEERKLIANKWEGALTPNQVLPKIPSPNFFTCFRKRTDSSQGVKSGRSSREKNYSISRRGCHPIPHFAWNRTG